MRRNRIERRYNEYKKFCLYYMNGGTWKPFCDKASTLWRRWQKSKGESLIKKGWDFELIEKCYKEMSLRYCLQCDNAKEVESDFVKSVRERLEEVARLLPSSGYTMGEVKKAYFKVGKYDITERNDDTYQYKGKWRGCETYGSVYVSLKPSEMVGYKSIHGVWTKITRRQKNGIHKCRCIIFQWEKPKSKNNGYVQKVVKDMYLAEYHSKFEDKTFWFHSYDKETAKGWLVENKEGEKRKARKAKREKELQAVQQKSVKAWAKSKGKFVENILKKVYTFDDSRNSGNCEVGTLQFCHRHHFDRDVKLSGRDLIRYARIDDDLRINIKRILHHTSGFYSYSKEHDEFNDYLDMLIDKVKIS